MKKTILAMVLMGSGAAALAQDSLSANNGNNNMNNGNVNTTNQVQRSTGEYPAYGSVAAPSAVQYNFNKEYAGVSDAQWRQTYNGYWRATYKQNGKQMNVYYDQNGQSFNVALPVLQSGVSEDIVNRAIDLYGNDIYDINMVKGHDNQTHYMVRIIENGQLRAERMKEDGTAYYDTNSNMNTTNGTNTNGTNSNSGTMRSSYYSENTTTDSTNTMNNGTNMNQPGTTTNGTSDNSGTTQHGPSAEGYGIDDTITDDTSRDSEDTETSEPNSELYNGGTRTELEYEEYTDDYEVY